MPVNPPSPPAPQDPSQNVTSAFGASKGGNLDIQDTVSPDGYIENFFSGTSPGTGDYSKWCSDQKGTIAGVGPKCNNTNPEQGAQDYAYCVFDHVKDYLDILREQNQPICEQIVAAKISGGDTSVLEKQAKQNEKDYQDKLKKLPNVCECKRCGWNVNTLVPKLVTPATNPNADKTKVNQVTQPRLTQVSTSSQYGIIPRLFGRYVTAGNIIWIGNQATTTVSFTQVVNGVSTPATESVSTVDMLVGLCIGPLTEVLRIWFGDVLIFNDTLAADNSGNVTLTANNNATTDLNLSVLADSQYNMARMQAYTPTVQLFSGSIAQHVAAAMANDVGWGRAPADRGIALLLFRDIDLRLFNGNFPEIRCDVIANQPKTLLPHILSDAHNFSGLALDQRTNCLVTLVGDTVREYGFNDLIQQINIDETALSPDFIAPTQSSQLLLHGGTTNYVIDPLRNRVTASYAAAGTPVICSSFLGYDQNTFAFDYALPQLSDGTFDFVQIDYTQDAITVYGPYGGDIGYTLKDAVITQISGIIYLFQFTTNGGILRVNRWAMTDANSGILTPVLHVYDTTLSGSAVYALLDTTDGNFIVFMDTTLYKLSSTDLSVLWSVTVSAPASRVSGFVGASQYLYYIDGSNNIISVKLDDGSVTTLTAISGFTGVGGPQVFDGNTASISYISSDATPVLTRLFVGKIVAAPLEIADIYQGLAAEIGVSINTADVEDVLLQGYYIDSAVSLADVANDLDELYQVVVVDDGTKLTVLKETTIIATTPTVIDDDNIFVNTKKRERVVYSNPTERATAKFFNIDDTGLVEMDTQVSLHPDLEEIPYEQVDFAPQLVDDADNIRIHLEKVLLDRLAKARTFDGKLSTRLVGLTPRDLINVNNEVYRANKQSFTDDYMTQTQAYFYDPISMDSDVSLSAVTLYTAPTVQRPTRQTLYRPVAFYINAITNADAIAGVQNQVIYTGIDAWIRQIEPTSFALRMDAARDVSGFISGGNVGTAGTPQASPQYVTDVHTEALHSGRVTTIPSTVLVDPFTTDNASELVIVFDHADTPNNFVASDQVVTQPTKNLLLVGRELIQFKNYVVGMDGVTVTFTELLRGRFGTEPYRLDHIVEEKAYLYTPETFKPLTIDAHYTYERQRARLFFVEPTMAGAPIVNYTVHSDPGSARPYAPTPVYAEGDPLDVTVFWRRRRSMTMDIFGVNNLGNLPEDWHYDTFGDNAQHEGFIVAHLQRLPTSVNEWDEKFMRPWQHGDAVDSSLIYNWQEVDDFYSFFLGDSSTDVLVGGVDPIYVAVLQIASIGDPNLPFNDPGGIQLVLGHPTFMAFRPDPTLPFEADSP